ncbi:unnamed protein product [Strongylus vulgaris]|uniref:Acyltransferase 3 domain-containing protein n=1 Tax=Strongylus vulgaris TaxID=40348 RepID=A0A3P7IFR4_STRVU|nr:unnamed protein product [Strongylus vulgaris]
MRRFFVISGFLTALNLSKKQNLDAQQVVAFYYIRVKRILPLYYLTIIGILLSLLMIVPRRYQTANIKSAKKALLLTSSVGNNDDQHDYVEKILQAEDLFVHTWPICIVMQWYFLIPLLFIIQRCLISHEKTFFTAITLLSILYYTTTDERTQYNSVLARIWQFVNGVIAYMLERSKVSLYMDFQIMNAPRFNVLVFRSFFR